MQYMLMIHDDGAAMQKATKPEMDSVMAAYEAYTNAMVEAGVLRAGERLRPSHTATTIRAPSGKAHFGCSGTPEPTDGSLEGQRRIRNRSLRLQQMILKNRNLC